MKIVVNDSVNTVMLLLTQTFKLKNNNRLVLAQDKITKS